MIPTTMARNARARSFMFDHLDRPIHVEDIAQAAGISPFHFARGFKEEVGHGPHSYLVLLRLAVAKLLLATTQSPLAEVARRSGFKTQAHFTGVFSRLVGTTPRKYRLAHTAKSEQEAFVNQTIDLEDDHERMIWARVFGVTEERLHELAEQHGPSVNNLRAALKRNETGRSRSRVRHPASEERHAGD